MQRLAAATLNLLPKSVGRPGYDFSSVTPGVAHLGAGAFHRAHQALVTDRALAAGARDWGVLACNLRSPALRDALAAQDGLYALEESGALRAAGLEALQPPRAARDDRQHAEPLEGVEERVLVVLPL